MQFLARAIALSGEIIAVESYFGGDIKIINGTDTYICEKRPNIKKQFILNGSVADRQNIKLSADKTEIAAGGTDYATISGLPDPCEVVVNGEVSTVTGGTVEIDSPIATILQVRFSSFPHLDAEITIEAI